MSQVPEFNGVDIRFKSSDLTQSLRIERALRGVEQLRQHAMEIEAELAETLQRTSPICRESAHNLVHYLAVRQVDIRPLQRELSQLGLSSFGAIEAHVMASLNAVLQTLHTLAQSSLPSETYSDPPNTFEAGQAMLDHNTDVLFGASREGRRVRIMVTMPSEAADDPSLIPTLLAQGMDVMRINCAFDGSDVWTRMLQQLRAAEEKLGKSCRVSFDLAGPKLRTGPVEPGPEVLKWRPSRNQLGQVVAPVVICLSSEPQADDIANTVVPVSSPFTSLATVGDEVHLRDARGHERCLKVVEAGGTTCVCVTGQSTHIGSDLEIELRRGSETVARARIGKLSPKPRAIPLSAGDYLRVVRGDIPGRKAVLDEDDRIIEPAVVGCSVPEVFRDARPGERIFFDDGKIAGVIREAHPDHLLVEIVLASGGTAKLRSEKGINLPDTDLRLPALTDKDIQNLEFIAEHGDMVALSFVQRPEDIEQLNRELKRLKAERLGKILKIETQRAFRSLPQLLLTAMQQPPLAIMVARGDLGVEIGFERLSEVQEEILWVCEAAHVPVIWATQVLESLAKGGMPSRAEVTDAAMGSRAECVMLNKGPYINRAVQFLCDVLGRMQAHHKKQTATLRQLSIADLQLP
jgi:pyruvate kinase